MPNLRTSCRSKRISHSVSEGLETGNRTSSLQQEDNITQQIGKPQALTEEDASPDKYCSSTEGERQDCPNDKQSLLVSPTSTQETGTPQDEAVLKVDDIKSYVPCNTLECKANEVSCGDFGELQEIVLVGSRSNNNNSLVKGENSDQKDAVSFQQNKRSCTTLTESCPESKAGSPVPIAGTSLEELDQMQLAGSEGTDCQNSLVGHNDLNISASIAKALSGLSDIMQVEISQQASSNSTADLQVGSLPLTGADNVSVGGIHQKPEKGNSSSNPQAISLDNEKERDPPFHSNDDTDNPQSIQLQRQEESPLGAEGESISSLLSSQTKWDGETTQCTSNSQSDGRDEARLKEMTGDEHISSTPQAIKNKRNVQEVSTSNRPLKKFKPPSLSQRAHTAPASTVDRLLCSNLNKDNSSHIVETISDTATDSSQTCIGGADLHKKTDIFFHKHSISEDIPSPQRPEISVPLESRYSERVQDNSTEEKDRQKEASQRRIVTNKQSGLPLTGITERDPQNFNIETDSDKEIDVQIKDFSHVTHDFLHNTSISSDTSTQQQGQECLHTATVHTSHSDPSVEATLDKKEKDPPNVVSIPKQGCSVIPHECMEIDQSPQPAQNTSLEDLALSHNTGSSLIPQLDVDETKSNKVFPLQAESDYSLYDEKVLQNQKDSETHFPSNANGNYTTQVSLTQPFEHYKDVDVNNHKNNMVKTNVTTELGCNNKGNTQIDEHAEKEETHFTISTQPFTAATQPFTVGTQPFIPEEVVQHATEASTVSNSSIPCFNNSQSKFHTISNDGNNWPVHARQALELEEDTKLTSPLASKQTGNTNAQLIANGRSDIEVSNNLPITCSTSGKGDPLVIDDDENSKLKRNSILPTCPTDYSTCPVEEVQSSLQPFEKTNLFHSNQLNADVKGVDSDVTQALYREQHPLLWPLSSSLTSKDQKKISPETIPLKTSENVLCSLPLSTNTNLAATSTRNTEDELNIDGAPSKEMVPTSELTITKPQNNKPPQTCNSQRSENLQLSCNTLLSEKDVSVRIPEASLQHGQDMDRYDSHNLVMDKMFKLKTENTLDLIPPQAFTTNKANLDEHYTQNTSFEETSEYGTKPNENKASDRKQNVYDITQMPESQCTNSMDQFLSDPYLDNITESQLCEMSSDNQFEQQFELARHKVMAEVAQSKTEGQKMISSIMADMVYINKQLLKIKREMDIAKRKMSGKKQSHRSPNSNSFQGSGSAHRKL